MPILTVCRGCGSKLKVPDEAAGHVIKCPKCSTSISLPPAAPPTPGPDGPSPTSSARKKPSGPPEPARRSASTDRNLLFGALALQAALIDNDQFAEACAAWVTRKDTPLGELLVRRGLLTAEGQQEVERLVRRHLEKHGGDDAASLAAVAGPALRRSLAGIEDPEVRQTLTELPREGDDGQGPTVAYLPDRRGRYRLTRLHAKGGIGRVWLARDAELGRDVALKELREERVGSAAHGRRFLVEAQITGQLEHPGIVPVYELVTRGPGQPPFYTMRFVRGRTLTKAVGGYHYKRANGRAGPLDLRALLNAFVAVCNALAYAHSRGVIHRDLKGDNVVLGDFGEVMLLDWGLAKLVGQAEEDGDLPPVALDGPAEVDGTQQGQVMGTPAYMAPEQAKGRLDQIGARTDIYGLGAILYELLTGEAPHGGGDTQEVIRKVIEEEPRRPRQVVPAVPAALEAVCLKALAKRAKDRYASAGELAADVQRWLADEPVTACREAPHRRLARWGRRHPTLLTAAALVLLAVGVGGFWLKHEQDARAVAAAREAAMTEGVVSAELQEVTHRIRGGNLDGAKEAVERAQDRLAGGSADLQQQVRQARTDLDMLARLEDVLMLETFTAGKHENQAASAAYTASFREYALDVVSLSPEEAAERIKASAIRDQLVTALDDWVFVTPRGDEAGRARLLGVVRLADSDAWRQQLRDPIMQKDRAALEQLAKQPAAAAQPPSILVHLGKYLAQAGAWPASVEVLGQAQRRHTGDFWVNYALAMALAEQKRPRLTEAVGFFRAAVALRPHSRMAHFSLARQLMYQQQSAEARAHFQKADEVAGPGEPRSVQVLAALGARLLQEAEFESAVAHLKMVLELLGPNDQRRPQIAEALREAERMAGVERRLPAVLRGEAKAADAAEKVVLAQICQQPRRRLYAASARFYSEAFDEQKGLAEGVRQPHRYNAACAAALAGTGQGEDAARRGEPARAKWRKRALEWLRADLDVWKKAAAGAPQEQSAARQTLLGWKADTDLVGIRAAAALAKLAPEEQAAFQALWSEVEAVLKKGQ